ncbi:MAG: SufD family Fe-S cluster assembly protein [Rikenellaceae bacterium]
MEQFIKSVAQSAEVILDARELVIDNPNSDKRYLLLSPRDMSIEIKGDLRAAQLVIIHSNSGESTLTIKLACGAKLNLVEVLFSPVCEGVNLIMNSDSSCEMSSIRVAGGNSRYDVNMEGRGANLVLNSLILAEDGECVKFKSNVRHLVPNCDSRSLTKSIAAGCSNIFFDGLVYVAKDAQKSNAEQSSRNIELGKYSKINIQPQLEIYADDVKCSHGATVGQLNSDAIWYMRQRGLSEDLAQRLQMEGFAMDVVSKCSVEDLHEELARLVEQKLLKM